MAFVSCGGLQKQQNIVYLKSQTGLLTFVTILKPFVTKNLVRALQKNQKNFIDLQLSDSTVEQCLIEKRNK